MLKTLNQLYKDRIKKSGQNVYAESGDIGSTVRETNPNVEEKSVAVDFHGTLNIDGKVNEELKNKLIEMKNAGYHIFIHTAGITHSPESLNGLHQWLQENNIPYDEIWQRNGKPDTDLIIDDKSIRPNEVRNLEV
jgi:effector-binding domain-containing protein